MAAGTTGSAECGDVAYWQALAVVQGLLFAAIVLFMARPDLDLAFSAAFAGPDGRFPLARDPAALAVRDFLRTLFFAIALLLLLGLALTLALGGRRSQSPAQLWAFAAAALLLGPGLLANAILKAYWGRARPDHVTEFGGADPYTLPFEMTDACARNCSFIAGEASTFATLALVCGVIAWRRTAGPARLALVLALAAPAVVAGGLHVAMGRHFLSDVVFACLLCALVVAALYPLFRVGALRERFTVGAVAADARLGWRVARRRSRPMRARAGIL